MKTVVVTGSSRGIGKEIALAFAREGYNVVVNSANRGEDGNKVASECAKFGIQSNYICADVSTAGGAEKLIRETISKFGGIDVLVNNAGRAQQKLLIDCTAKDVEKTLLGNISGIVYPTIYALKTMKDTGGSIINISSIQSVQKGSTESLYAAAKAGIVGFSRAVSCEYGSCGIRVNAICPGYIKTKMTEQFSADDEKNFAEITPLGRIGSPKDVAGLAVFLASDKASFITGEAIFVDGGVTKA